MRDILILTAVWNIIVFGIFGADKWKASHSKWRISERTLILICFFMGSVGGILGMYVWRHKTRRMKFKILTPLAFLCNAAVLWVIGKYFCV